MTGRRVPPAARVRRGRHPEADVGLLEAAARADEDVSVRARNALARAPRGPRGSRPPPEQALGRAEDVGRPHPARGRDDEVLGPVAGAVMPNEILAADRSHRIRGAEDRRAERMSLPERADEVLVREIFGVVVGLADLLENHPALDLDIGGGERRRQHDVAEQVEGFGEPDVKRPRVEARVLPGREGVHFAAEPVDLPSDLDVGAAPGPLEEKVFQKMREALPGGRLLRRARAHEEAERERPHVRHRIDEDRDAVLEDLADDAASHLDGAAGVRTPGLGPTAFAWSLSASPAMKRHSSVLLRPRQGTMAARWTFVRTPTMGPVVFPSWPKIDDGVGVALGPEPDPNGGGVGVSAPNPPPEDVS
jgi:hypothetical protein